MLWRYEDASRTAIHAGKKTGSLAHRRRVNDGHQFFEMHAQYLVKQHLIAIEELRQVDMPANGIGVEANREILAFGLRRNIVVLCREHSFNAEAATLLESEPGTLVIQRQSQHLATRLRGTQNVALRRSLQIELFH